ncbi:MAG TPA: hypothetical protein VM265_10850, partial [Sphingomicrobium sp.]|nr:hypothetical protein [Sphingomicrobium sp.]
MLPDTSRERVDVIAPHPTSAPATRRTLRRVMAVILCSAAAPAAAQQAFDGPDILVIGERDRLGVRAERVLTAADIASYGASNVGELLDEIRRERGQAGDAPAFLINGRRVSGLGDIESYPVEALDRIQVLPAGSGIAFGASASQRLYNIVLKPQARTVAGRASTATATDGGANSRSGELSFTDI